MLNHTPIHSFKPAITPQNALTAPTPTMPASISEPLEDAVLQALRLWYAPESDGSPLHALRISQQLQRNGHATVRQASNELLRRALEELKIAHPDEQTILQLRFIDEQQVHVVANRMNLADGSIWRKQQLGIRHLAESIYKLERQVGSTQRSRLLARLAPPSYSQLLGVAPLLNELNEALTPGQAPWLVAIEGLGGLGKSAVADAFCRQQIEWDVWEDFAWVTVQARSLDLGGEWQLIAKPIITTEGVIDALIAQLVPEAPKLLRGSLEMRLETLYNRLKERPHLIVIDGVEAHWQINDLLLLLRRLAGPSKFLLTTRQRLLSEADIYHLPLAEIAQPDALNLVRFEAKMRNLRDVAIASDQELRPIYDLVGGNPLALRLVVGQLHIHPLSQILADLTCASTPSIINLYDFIYRKAWDVMDESARQVLLPLLLVSEQGETFEEIVEIAKDRLQRQEVRAVLDFMVKLGLLEVGGGFHERRYTIHHLTRTFLQQQLHKWVSAASSEVSPCVTRFNQFVVVALQFLLEEMHATSTPSAVLIEKAWRLVRYTSQIEAIWPQTRDLLLAISLHIKGREVEECWQIEMAWKLEQGSVPG